MKVNIGNLLEQVSSGHIVHGCNAKGVMGGGFAKAIREIYPQVYVEYRKRFVESGLNLGDAIPVRIKEGSVNVVVWNCITQLNFGNDGSLYTNYNAVSMSMRKVNDSIDSFGDVERTVHFPLIGAGLGGGDWRIIEKILDEELDDFNSRTLWVLTREDYLKAKPETLK